MSDKLSPERQSRSESLGLRDQLDDLLAGFEFWRKQKVSNMEWTTTDEMLARWVEHHELPRERERPK